MFFVSMPKRATSAALVERATKCLATADSSPAAFRNHSFAVWAFVRVSCVVKVFEATTNSVVSGRRVFKVSTTCVPSTFETKWTRGPSA